MTLLGDSERGTSRRQDEEVGLTSSRFRPALHLLGPRKQREHSNWILWERRIIKGRFPSAWAGSTEVSSPEAQGRASGPWDLETQPGRGEATAPSLALPPGKGVSRAKRRQKPLMELGAGTVTSAPSPHPRAWSWQRGSGTWPAQTPTQVAGLWSSVLCFWSLAVNPILSSLTREPFPSQFSMGQEAQYPSAREGAGRCSRTRRCWDGDGRYSTGHRRPFWPLRGPSCSLLLV